MLAAAVASARRRATMLAGRCGQHLLADLQSELVYRTGKAWLTFDPEGTDHCSWQTWLNRHWAYGLRDVMRAASSERHRQRAAFLAKFELVEWDEPVRGLGDDSTPVTYADVEPDPESDFVTPLLELDELASALATLTDQERRVIEGLYFQGTLRRELAAFLGVPPGELQRVEREALDRLRAVLEEDR